MPGYQVKHQCDDAKKYRVIITTAGGRDIFISLDEREVLDLYDCDANSWFSICSNNNKYMINMRNVTSIRVEEDKNEH